LKIIVVDDEAPIRKLFHKILEPQGHEVLDAENGKEAIEIINNSDVSLVITDIVMPIMHGVDLIMSLKKSFPDLPIIAMSGGGGISGRFNYLEIAGMIGAENIFNKPCPKDKLLKFLEKYE